MAQLRTLDAEDLGQVIKRSRRIVLRVARERPNELPPQLRRVGREPLWLEEDVLAWLRGEQVRAVAETRPRGRPRRLPAGAGGLAK